MRQGEATLSIVLAGLGSAIHACGFGSEDVDARDKPAQDGF
jgi:hypothetical protein